MGSLISAHVIRIEPNPSLLFDAIPESIGYRWYKHKHSDLFAMDTFPPSKHSEYSFQTRLPTKDISVDLPSELSVLSKLYEVLKLGNGFSRAYITFTVALSKRLATSVLSIVSDDDEIDFTCTAAHGTVGSVRCRCEDFVVNYSAGSVRIQPLIPEFEEDEELLTSFDAVREKLPEVEIAERNVTWDAKLHAIALQEWDTFSCGVDPEQIGLGTFDPDYEKYWEAL